AGLFRNALRRRLHHAARTPRHLAGGLAGRRGEAVVIALLLAQLDGGAVVGAAGELDAQRVDRLALIGAEVEAVGGRPAARGADLERLEAHGHRAVGARRGRALDGLPHRATKALFEGG